MQLDATERCTSLAHEVINTTANDTDDDQNENDVANDGAGRGTDITLRIPSSVSDAIDNDTSIDDVVQREIARAARGRRAAVGGNEADRKRRARIVRIERN